MVYAAAALARAVASRSAPTRMFHGSMLVVTDLLCGHPGVVGEAAVDLGFAVCVDDQQRADAPVFGARERPAEEDEALVCERVHERRVVADRRLLDDPSSGCPGRSSFTDDGEVAHRARAIR